MVARELANALMSHEEIYELNPQTITVDDILIHGMCLLKISCSAII